MGTSVIYQAVAPASEFYRRLRSDRPLALLVSLLLPYGSGLFRLFDGPDEAEGFAPDLLEYVEDLIWRFPDDFEADALEEARRQLARLREALEAARAASPGIEGRSVRLEKSVEELRQRLRAALPAADRVRSGWLVDALLFGEESLECLDRGDGESVGVVSAATLADGAAAFGTSDLRDPDGGGPPGPDRRSDEFRSWQALVVESAGRGDVLLVRAS